MSRGIGIHAVHVVIAIGLLTAGAMVAHDVSPAAAQGSDQLQPGETLDQSNWEKAKGLLPPEILRHYRDGEYVNQIVDWPADTYTWPTDFLAGSQSNEGRFAIGKEGHVVDAKTGKQPPFIIGFPFPKVNAQDPDAGAKTVWNFLYRTWYFGNSRNESQLNFVSTHGLDRRVDVDVRFMYYDGVTDEEKVPNPQNFTRRIFFTSIRPSRGEIISRKRWRAARV